MGDDNKFITPEYMLTQFSEMLMREDGPMTTEELCEQLNETFGVCVYISAVRFNIPEMWLDDILDNDNRFVMDDSERYHLTDHIGTLED